MVDNFLVLREEGGRGGQADFAARAHMINLFSTGKAARANSQECGTVAVLGVHVRLNLEHEGAKVVFVGAHRALVGFAHHRRRRKLCKSVQQLTHAEVVHRGTEEHGAHFALQELFVVERIHGTGHHLVFFLELGDPVLAAHFYKARIVRAFHLDDFLMAFFFIEGMEGVFDNGIHALEQLTHAYGERKGGNLDFQDAFDFVEQVEHVAAIQVHLVDERDDRRMAHAAHVHELDSLLFYTVHAIDKHESCINGGECAVSIFAEVLVPRGIDQVEHAIFEREIQHGTGNRNTTLLFDLHPVTHRVAAVCLGTHVTRFADDISVPEELFGDGGLTRVGVADNSKSAAFFDFCVHRTVNSG